MFSSKQVHLQRDFAAGVYLSEAQNPLPPITHYKRVYRIITHTGEGGRVESKRRLEGQQFAKLGRKY